LSERIERNPILVAFNLPEIARPSVRLVTQRVLHGRIGMGESRIGGTPDVVPGFQWLRWAPAKQREDKFGQRWKPDGPAPMGFTAQIDLADLPRVEA
jgi:Domain of unknown function (DUF1963)